VDAIRELIHEELLEGANPMDLDDGFTTRPCEVGHRLRHDRVGADWHFLQGGAIECFAMPKKPRPLDHHDVFVFRMAVRKYYLPVVVPDPDHVVPAFAVRVSVENLYEPTVFEHANDTGRLAGRLTSRNRHG
jgi:hypothetical protein